MKDHSILLIFSIETYLIAIECCNFVLKYYHNTIINLEQDVNTNRHKGFICG